MAGFDMHGFAAAYAAPEEAAFPALSPVQQLVLRRLVWLTRGKGSRRGSSRRRGWRTTAGSRAYPWSGP